MALGNVDGPQDEALVASLPVYLNGLLSTSAQLQMFQYPLYPRGRPLPVPTFAAQRGETVTSRWRPHANRVEMDIPLDLRDAVYDSEKGEALAEVRQRSASIPVSGSGDVHVKQEQPATESSARFDQMRLESSVVPNATEYMVGIMRNGELHLTPLHAILQLRPSMRHVDLLHQAEDGERRRERGAHVSDEEEHNAAVPQRDARRSSVIPLNVSVRNESGSRANYGQGAFRDAEAERWVDLQWIEEKTPAVEQVANNELLATSRAPLYCATKPQDFL
ncbi:hypothetical protein MVES_000987 [Malassezia vespertilionis]|uniref:Uncharacterized protein n=1 Tax=Malassezia vespertilionis TaxID=2020962 RepID=A0A2N1JEZ8_9BASI|nr:hypothetical protein MVES_000987 [Malassezia vespertilionis]